jgi:ribonucleoside-diphosphate reductase alpha chain
VADRAWRLHQTLHGPHTAFPPTLTTALGVSPQAHLEMVGAVAPFIDGSIAKTINLATDCSTEHIDALLRRAWRLGLKGLTVFRPPEATV